MSERTVGEIVKGLLLSKGPKVIANNSTQTEALFVMIRMVGAINDFCQCKGVFNHWKDPEDKQELLTHRQNLRLFLNMLDKESKNQTKTMNSENPVLVFNAGIEALEKLGSKFQEITGILTEDGFQINKLMEDKAPVGEILGVLCRHDTNPGLRSREIKSLSLPGYAKAQIKIYDKTAKEFAAIGRFVPMLANRIELTMKELGIEPGHSQGQARG